MVSFEKLDFGQQLDMAEEYVREYCQQKGVELIGVRRTWERGFLEPLYFFDDGLGGYTIGGIVESLR